jgi:hypothetical protein
MTNLKYGVLIVYDSYRLALPADAPGSVGNQTSDYVTMVTNGHEVAATDICQIK